MKVVKTLKLDITEDHVNELCDFLNEKEFDGHDVLNLKVVTSHPKLFDFLFDLNVCGWILEMEEMFQIWGNDGWCDIFNVLDECGIEYEQE